MDNFETKLVPFMGDELMAVKDNDGQIWAAVRYVCNGIGFNKTQTNSQVEKIKSDFVLSKVYGNFRTPTSGGYKESLCLHLDYVPLWLAKISVTPTMARETPEVAEKLVQYQLKAKDVLAAAFLPKQTTHQTAREIYAEARRLEADAKQRNAALREKSAKDKRDLSMLSMYLKAKGPDKLLMLETLRQEGYSSDTMDYVENAIKADIEAKAAKAVKGGNGRESTGSAKNAQPDKEAEANYQEVLEHIQRDFQQMGFRKSVKGRDCLCVGSVDLRNYLASQGVYDRDFLKWAKTNGAIVTEANRNTICVRSLECSKVKKCVCFIVGGGSGSAEGQLAIDGGSET